MRERSLVGEHMFKQAWNIVLLVIAVLMVLVGLVTFLLPIPFGIVLLLMGIAMLMMVSPPVCRWFHRLRGRYPSLDRRLTDIEPHLPVSLQKILRPDNAG